MNDLSLGEYFEAMEVNGEAHGGGDQAPRGPSDPDRLRAVMEARMRG